MQEQIQHKIEVLEYFRENSEHKQDTRFVLVGHSVGAYIALKVHAARCSHLCTRMCAHHTHNLRVCTDGEVEGEKCSHNAGDEKET